MQEVKKDRAKYSLKLKNKNNKLYKEVEDFQKQHLGSHILLAGRILKKFLINKLKRFNIGFEQLNVMFYLTKYESLNTTELVYIMHKDKGTVSRCIESLRLRDLVYKVQDKKDARVFSISLTPSGLELFSRVQEVFLEISNSVDDKVTPKQREEFHEILDKLIDVWQ